MAKAIVKMATFSLVVETRHKLTKDYIKRLYNIFYKKGVIYEYIHSISI